ncbi:MAG: hypothetical protein KF756_07995 [Acidobacteria bacterium]|nr:hypothetical protein [Acidobacteriota bacterium]
MNSSKQKREQEECKNDTRHSRLDRFFYYWGKFRFYRHLCTLLFVFLLYLWARDHSMQKEAAQLKFVETPTAQTEVSGSSDAEAIKPVLSGKEFDSAMRLRESGALLMAVSLSAFDEFRVSGRLPANSVEVLDGLQKRSLLPPGIEVNQGVFHSSLSVIFLNYRADPFTFEIVSFPLDSGPMLLFRFPLPSMEANSIVYFQSSAASPVSGPAPFSSTEQLVATGWRIVRWRGDTLPLNETVIRDLQEQEEWLKSQAQGR